MRPSPSAAIENEEPSKSYLIFSLAGELYGAHLLSVREVIKQGVIKPVPFMAPHFKGMINLRGQIVSIVDLRLKFGPEIRSEKTGIILIVDAGERLLGGIVDDLINVHKVSDHDIEKPPSLETKIAIKHFLGVAKIGDRPVSLIDLSGCLASEDFRLKQGDFTTEKKGL